MNVILLKIEIGSWDGGHDGKYPKTIEWDLDDRDSPILVCDGWGHGVGGGALTLEKFVKNRRFSELSKGGSTWAHTIISNGVIDKLSVMEIGERLRKESLNHIIHVPEQLQVFLGSRVRWINA